MDITITDVDVRLIVRTLHRMWDIALLEVWKIYYASILVSYYIYYGSNNVVLDVRWIC